MGKHILWPIVILFFLPNLHGQALRSSLRKAKEAFYHKDFSEALDYAERALKKDSLVVDALYIGGESARRLRKFERAEQLLSRIPDSAKQGTYSSTDFNLGLCQKSMGKYEEAMHTFRSCKAQRKGENDLLNLLAADELETCRWALKSLEDSTMATVVEMPKDAGSATSSEFAPLRYADKIYFSAPFQINEKEVPVSRIFTRIQDRPAQLFSENPRRPDAHASNVALMPDASRMYFTICLDEEYFQQSRCEIWSRDRTYDGNWTAPSRLPYPVNFRGFTSTQPSIGWDRSLKKYVLYFVSDRPGGKGKLDIWSVPIDRHGNFGEAACHMANTPDDDITPFFHQASQTLFFSSNGHPGLGGFDIFQTKIKEDETWAPIENMGTPLNTSHDDLYYTWNMGAQRAYFSSNRDNRECPTAPRGDFCTDIFEAEIFATLAVQAKDEVTETTIENFTVYISAPQKGAPPLEYENFSTTRPKIVLAIGKQYEVTVTAPGYFPHQFMVNTSELTKSEHIMEEVRLKRAKNISP